MQATNFRRPRLAWLLALVWAGQAGAGWQQDWSETGPAFDTGPYDYLRTYGHDDGSALVSFATGGEHRLSRLRADGSVDWHALMPQGEWRPVDASYEPDGAALVLFTGYSYGAVARYDTAGTLAWSSGVQGTRFAVGGDLVAASLPQGSDAVVTGIDRYSGQLRWQVRVAGYGGGAGREVPLAIDAEGNTYVALDTDTTGNARLAKLNAHGALQWNQPVVGIQKQALAVRNGRVFLGGSSSVQSFAAADGSLQWYNGECGIIEAPLHFVGDDPLCGVAANLRRLRSSNGSELWRRTSTDYEKVLGVLGGDVYLSTDLTTWPDLPGTSRLRRLAGGSGVEQWQITLPYVARLRAWQVSDSLFGALAAGDVPGSVALHRYRIADGSLFDKRHLPPVTRGALTTGQLHDGSDLFVLSQRRWDPLPARASRLAADSGSVIWENAATQSQAYPGMAATPNRLLLAEQATTGDARVRSIDRTSGQQRWEQIIAPRGHYLAMGKAPRLLGLDDGDAIVSYGYGPSDGGSRRVQELQRLDDEAGQVLWKKLITEWQDGSSAMYGVEPPLLGIGQDALLWPAGGLAGPYFDLQRRAGLDGAIAFSTDAGLLSQKVRRSVAGDAVFAVGQPGSTTLRLVKHSASTGERLWQFDYAVSSWPAMKILEVLPLADNDVVVLLQLYQTGEAGVQTTRLLRVKNDGSGLRYAYRTTGPSLLRDDIERLVLAPNGDALLLRRLYDGRRGLDFVQRFDLAQGRLLGSQALSPRGVDPFLHYTAWGDLFEPHGEGLLISGIALRAPQPLLSRHALLDIAVARHGDLALQLPAIPASTVVGDTLPFAATVSYEGDAAIADATLLLELPWQGGESGLLCAGPGISRCELTQRHGQIIARFDAAPGARLSLSGQLRVLHAPARDKIVLRGLVYAPVDLQESDFLNNFQHVGTEGLIFADGFD